MKNELIKLINSLQALLKNHPALVIDKSWVGADEIPESYKNISQEIAQVNKDFDAFYDALMQEEIPKNSVEKVDQSAKNPETLAEVLSNAWSEVPIDIINSVLIPYTNFVPQPKILEKLDYFKVKEVLDVYYDEKIVAIIIKMFCFGRYYRCSDISRQRADLIYKLYVYSCEYNVFTHEPYPIEDRTPQCLVDFFYKIPMLVSRSVVGFGSSALQPILPQDNDCLVDGYLGHFDWADLGVDFSAVDLLYVDFSGVTFDCVKLSTKTIISALNEGYMNMEQVFQVVKEQKQFDEIFSIFDKNKNENKKAELIAVFRKNESPLIIDNKSGCTTELTPANNHNLSQNPNAMFSNNTSVITDIGTHAETNTDNKNQLNGSDMLAESHSYPHQ